MNFSKVARYFTLSLASFNLSVNYKSNLLYSQIVLLIQSSPLLEDDSYLFYYIKALFTNQKSWDFNYSWKLVIFYILDLQYSNSVEGPSSALSFFNSESSFNILLIFTIHCQNFLEYTSILPASVSYLAISSGSNLNNS